MVGIRHAGVIGLVYADIVGGEGRAQPRMERLTEGVERANERYRRPVEPQPLRAAVQEEAGGQAVACRRRVVEQFVEPAL